MQRIEVREMFGRIGQDIDLSHEAIADGDAVAKGVAGIALREELRRKQEQSGQEDAGARGPGKTFEMTAAVGAAGGE